MYADIADYLTIPGLHVRFLLPTSWINSSHIGGIFYHVHTCPADSGTPECCNVRGSHLNAMFSIPLITSDSEEPQRSDRAMVIGSSSRVDIFP